MSTAQKEASKATSKKIKKLKDAKEIASKKDQGDILGDRFEKRFKKFRESKEAQLQADDFKSGVDRAERRAAIEVAREAGIPLDNVPIGDSPRDNFSKSYMAKGGRAMYKSGMRVCKLAKRGKGRAYGKNS